MDRQIGRWIAWHSNHLSIHQWVRSPIHESPQPTSPIGFLFLTLPLLPCAVLLASTFAIKILITDKVVKQGSEARVSRKVPRTDSQARFPRTGCSCCKEQLPKKNFPSKTSKNSCKQGAKQEKTPKQDYEKPVPSKVPRTRCHVKQGSQASSAGTGFQETNRFASKVFKNRCPGKVPRIVNRTVQSLICF